MPGIFAPKIYDLKKMGFDFGLKDYPIFKEEHREKLNEKLINEYLFEEIGFETAAEFKIYLNKAMEKIMPYYNELYETAAMDFQIGVEFQTQEEADRNENEKKNGSYSHSDKSENFRINSKPPQSKVTYQDLKNGAYGNNSEYSTEDSQGSNTEYINGTKKEKNEIKRLGRNASMTQLIQEYRKAILNIDRLIIEDEEIKTLFFGIYA